MANVTITLVQPASLRPSLVPGRASNQPQAPAPPNQEETFIAPGYPSLHGAGASSAICFYDLSLKTNQKP